jgi:hypothetical protein
MRITPITNWWSWDNRKCCPALQKQEYISCPENRQAKQSERGGPLPSMGVASRKQPYKHQGKSQVNVPVLRRRYQRYLRARSLIHHHGYAHYCNDIIV